MEGPRTPRHHADAGHLHGLGALLVGLELAAVLVGFAELAAEPARVEIRLWLPMAPGPNLKCPRAPAGGGSTLAGGRQGRARIGHAGGGERASHLSLLCFGSEDTAKESGATLGTLGTPRKTGGSRWVCHPQQARDFIFNQSKDPL